MDFEDDHDYNEEDSTKKRASGTKRTSESSGIVLYFLAGSGITFRKFRSLIRYFPYFYLVIEDNQTEEQIRRIIWSIEQKSDGLVRNVKLVNLYDSKRLVFPEKHHFLRIETFVPGSIPKLRDILAKLSGVVEWREADVLFHRRAAIDLKLRVGKWYVGEFAKGECIRLTEIQDQPGRPPLRLLAYDIETSNSQHEQPDPSSQSGHKITMISCYSDIINCVLVNGETVRIPGLSDMFVTTRRPDSTHERSWISYSPALVTREATSFLESLGVTNALKMVLTNNSLSKDGKILQIAEIISKSAVDITLERITSIISNLVTVFSDTSLILDKLSILTSNCKEIARDDNVQDLVPVLVLFCPSEKSMIERFLEVVDTLRPEILTDFNGHKFDIPFLNGRALELGIPFQKVTGFAFKPRKGLKESLIRDWMHDVDEVISYGVMHLDSYLWTKKYSYLPKGMQGLKPAVRSKLKIIPIGREALWNQTDNETAEDLEGWENSTVINKDFNNRTSKSVGKGTGQSKIISNFETVAYSASDAYVTW
ncbi:MAG TPA: 3'-5' exonuclease, partial [Candidatus Hodarchaeales archaeon]|nr:3'-5' exonuclease [Candidatus Hodarchaeales archaeon]